MTSGRRIDDAGEKIGGARKDFSKSSLTTADLSDMTDAEMVSRVQKDNVWPKPDYASLVDNGMSPEAAALVKIIRDRIAKSPAVRKGTPHSTTLSWYVEALSQVSELLVRCRTTNDVRAVLTVAEENVGRKNSDPSYWRSEGRNKVDIIRRGRMNPLYVSPDDSFKVRDLLKRGFPSEIPAWKRGYSVARLTGHETFVLVSGKRIVAKGFENEKAAWDWLEDNRTTITAQPTSSKRIPERPHLDHISREGMQNYRDGQDIDPETFIDVFGFRGVEFGEWLPDDERQAVLNFGYDAFMDLADVIGFEPGQLSLGGKLAIAFGARGTGRAAAHYEADRMVVNLTRLSGAGSLAHEWGHALDHLIGLGSAALMEIPSLTGWLKAVSDAKMVLKHRGAEVAETAQGVLDAIYSRPLTKSEKIARIEESISTAEKYASGWEKAIRDEEQRVAGGGRPLPTHMRKLKKGLQGNINAAARNREILEVTLSRPDNADFGRAKSNYSTVSESISGPGGYWARPNELFARAFESFVEDEIVSRGGYSSYLVSGTSPQCYPEELYRACPYPSGQERDVLRERFSSLVSACAYVFENSAKSDFLNSGRQPSPSFP